MKITRTASGKKTLKISQKEWQAIGKKAGWAKSAQTIEQPPQIDRERVWELISAIGEARHALKNIAEIARMAQGETQGQFIGNYLDGIRRNLGTVQRLSQFNRVVVNNQGAEWRPNNTSLPNVVNDSQQFIKNPTPETAQQVYNSAKNLEQELTQYYTSITGNSVTPLINS